MRIRLVIALVLAWPALHADAAVDSSPESTLGEANSPVTRVVEVARAALAGPDLDASRARLDAATASARVEAHPGSPYVELQREGISQFFATAENASWYLRFGSPFNAPWNGGSVRDSVEATHAYVAAQKQVEGLKTAGRAVGVWLDLAAANDRLLVRRSQLERLEAALELQRKRLELGEVSGAEVTQLRLERLRLVGEVNAHRADRSAASETLLRLAGPAVPRPQAGDLLRLVAELGPPDTRVKEVDLRLESSPVFVATTLDTERIRLSGERDRKTVWGRPEAEISWEHIPGTSGADGFDAIGLRLRVPLPIGGAGKRQSALSAARQGEALANQERTRRELKARINAEQERLRVASEVLDELDEIEADLPSVEQSISERFRLGALAYLEYIDGLSRLDEVRVQAIDARRAVLRARLDLAVLTGDARLFPLPDPDQETDR